MESVVTGLELWQWRNAAQKAAIAADVSPREVDWLLQELAGIERLSLRLNSFKDKPLIELQIPLTELDRLWQQRLYDQFPVQYIAKIAPWRQFKLIVSPAVLIPRPETECLIDLAVKVAGSNTQLPGHWVDLGTGSGAIAVGLADVFPKATIHAVDYSLDALAIAKLNAQRLGFSERIMFYQGSWWQPLEALKGKVSGMVANPPYIPSSLVPQLQPEVTKHEPHLALDGGEDGLTFIRYLIETSPTYLKPGGIWLIEMMAGQAETVAELLQNHGSYCQIQIYPDLAGIDRFAFAQIIY